MPNILIKRGTATQWTNSTTPLLSGELGLDTSNNILKVGNGTALWNSLSGLTLSASQVDELAQDAIASAFNHQDHSNIVVTYDDSNNKITLSTGPDVVTSSDLGNSLGDYVPLADVGNADGVAPLDENSLIPDEYIPSTIARDSELFSGSYDDLTDKPTIPSLTGYATETYVDTAVSGLVDSAPTTLNTLNELAAALGDDPNYATTISTALGNKLDSTTASSTYLTQTNASSTYLTQTNASSTYLTQTNASNTYLTQTNASNTYAPKASPTFTGTVSGITKSMVGLGNVDNTSDANKPVSTATQTALDNKSDKSITINAKSGSYTLATSDLDKMIEMSGGGTLTISDSASFAIGFTCNVLQTGSSQVTIAGNGFTPNATPGLKLRAQWSSATLVKRALNSWVVMGDLSA